MEREADANKPSKGIYGAIAAGTTQCGYGEEYYKLDELGRGEGRDITSSLSWGGERGGEEWEEEGRASRAEKGLHRAPRSRKN